MNCKVMGIVNITPDSFSDGGKYFTPDEAVRRSLKLIDEGADIIDLGAESTRPGATPIGWQEEWRRLEPVLPSLVASGVPISVDTYHPETAERAVDAGVGMINCVYSEPVKAMVAIASRVNRKVELVVPASCRADLGDFNDFYLDPMVGFGTTREEDMALLASVSELSRQGRVLVGASRKRIVKKLTGEKVVGKNLGGNLAIALWCAKSGASCVRVHDVSETVQLLRVWKALENVREI